MESVSHVFNLPGNGYVAVARGILGFRRETKILGPIFGCRFRGHLPSCEARQVSRKNLWASAHG